uniref:Monoacylglycerol lipase ABHD12 n=1 Tax=Talaromyces marneffei PM1 TaxID=1077442 RepID=A0A093UXB8_TALMA
MGAGKVVTSFFEYAFISIAAAAGLYATLLTLLTTKTFQSHAVYLHAVQMTWFKDLNVPETFGFLKNQVTPFSIPTPDGELLYAWHILPIELYRKHELALTAESTDARLILHMHGAGGTVGSGYRVPNYRALSAGQPDKSHVLTFDYRGFGHSTGSPSENGLILDALTVVDWAMNVAGIPASRIAIFAQSMGTAVSIAVSEKLALQSPPVVFAGTVLVAPFVDCATLVSTYSVAGVIPLLAPLARFPLLFDHLRRFIRDNWLSKDRIAQYKKLDSKLDLGAAGSVMEWKTDHGVIREEILKTGLHDVVMGYPIVTMAVMRAFEAADPSFTR